MLLLLRRPLPLARGFKDRWEREVQQVGNGAQECLHLSTVDGALGALLLGFPHLEIISVIFTLLFIL